MVYPTIIISTKFSNPIKNNRYLDIISCINLFGNYVYNVRSKLAMLLTSGWSWFPSIFYWPSFFFWMFLHRFHIFNNFSPQVNFFGISSQMNSFNWKITLRLFSFTMNLFLWFLLVVRVYRFRRDAIISS